jgi:hypothetical protein
MPKKELTDFQLELLQKKRNKERVKQEQALRKRIFALGVEKNASFASPSQTPTK